MKKILLVLFMFMIAGCSNKKDIVIEYQSTEQLAVEYVNFCANNKESEHCELFKDINFESEGMRIAYIEHNRYNVFILLEYIDDEGVRGGGFNIDFDYTKGAIKTGQDLYWKP